MPAEPTKARLDRLGGVVPADKARARDAGLTTLPTTMLGANCSLCTWFNGYSGQAGFCEHPRVKFRVNDRQICTMFETTGGLRTWEG